MAGVVSVITLRVFRSPRVRVRQCEPNIGCSGVPKVHYKARHHDSWKSADRRIKVIDHREREIEDRARAEKRLKMKRERED